MRKPSNRRSKRPGSPAAGGKRQRVVIEIDNVSGKRVDVATLKRLLAKAVRAAKVRCGEWRIALVDDGAMGGLHQRTMGIPTTTDVLTFDLRDESTSDCPLDLDTVICVDEARRQAKERRLRLVDELTLYAVHSMLHVCGYNDLEPGEAQLMHEREDEILRRIGIGIVYAKENIGRGSR